MKNKSFREESAADRETRLWNASKEYMSGDITIDQFEAVELPYAQHFKQANLTTVRRTSKSKVSIYLINLVSIAFLVGGLVVFLLTRNWGALVAIAASTFSIGPKVVDYFQNKRNKI